MINPWCLSMIFIHTRRSTIPFCSSASERRGNPALPQPETDPLLGMRLELMPSYWMQRAHLQSHPSISGAVTGTTRHMVNKDSPRPNQKIGRLFRLFPVYNQFED